MTTIILDTETTGLDPIRHRVIEVAAVVLEGLDVVATFSTLSNPGTPHLGPEADEALSINHITRDLVAVAPPEQVAREQSRFFLNGWPGATLTTYNVKFDRGFLEAGGWIPDYHPFTWGPCLMEQATEDMGRAGVVDRHPGGGWRWPRLDAAARFYGVPDDNGAGAHTALRDALVAVEIYRGQQRRKQNGQWGKPR